MAVLASYCECWALTKKCNHTISAEGVMVGEKVHPAVRARDAAMTQLRNYAREPGLSPVARVRLPEGRPTKRPTKTSVHRGRQELRGV